MHESPLKCICSDSFTDVLRFVSVVYCGCKRNWAAASWVALCNQTSSLVPRPSWNANMYRRESLVSFPFKHDIIEIGLKQKGNVLCIVQPIMCSMLSVYDIQPPITSKLAAIFACSFSCSESRVRPHLIIWSLYPISTFDGSHVRKNTRLSPHVQLQYRLPEQRNLGTRLLDFHTKANLS